MPGPTSRIPPYAPRHANNHARLVATSLAHASCAHAAHSRHTSLATLGHALPSPWQRPYGYRRGWARAPNPAHTQRHIQHFGPRRADTTPRLTSGPTPLVMPSRLAPPRPTWLPTHAWADATNTAHTPHQHVTSHARVDAMYTAHTLFTHATPTPGRGDAFLAPYAPPMRQYSTLSPRLPHTLFHHGSRSTLLMALALRVPPWEGKGPQPNPSIHNAVHNAFRPR